MIKVNKKIRIKSGTAPFTYKWINATPNCVDNFDEPSGTTDEVVNTDIYFKDSCDIENALIRLLVEDAEGCSDIYNISFENPCDVLESNGFNEFVSPDGSKTIESIVTGGSGNYTYIWSAPKSIIVLGENDNQLKYTVSPFGSNNPSIDVNVIIIDNESGCELSDTYTITFCNPRVNNISILMCKDPQDGSGTFSDLFLTAEECQSEIDWSTLEITAPTLDNLFSWNHVNTPENNIVNLFLNANVDVGTHPLNYTVRDVDGNISNVGIISIELIRCVTPSPNDPTPESSIFAPTIIKRVEDGEVGSIPYEIILADLDSYISGQPVWETFRFIPTTGQSTSNEGEDAELTTSYGTISFDSDHVLTYNVTSDPPPVEIIQWEVEDGNSRSTGIVTLIIIHEEIVKPSTTSDTACQTCESPYPWHDVLSNDSDVNGNLDPASVMIVTPPAINEGIAYANSDGEIQFVPDPDFEGTVTIGYKVANFSGVYSDEETLEITVICAGSDSEYEACI